MGSRVCDIIKLMYAYRVFAALLQRGVRMQQENVMTIEYMDDAVRIADFCNVLYFKGKQVISPKDVHEADKEVRLIQRRWGKIFTRALYRDVLCRVVLGVRYLFIGVEHQSQVDYTMPVRIMEYDAGTYRRQLRKIRKRHRRKRDLKHAQYVSGFSEQDHVEPVLTTLLYFGKEPWVGPRDIHGMMKLEGEFEELKDVIPNYKINIVEARDFSQWESFKSDLRQVFGYLHHLTAGKDIMNYVQENREEYENLAEEVYDLLSTVTNAKELKAIKKQYQKENGGINMCEVLQQLINDGRQEGLSQGLSQGLIQGRIELICQKLDRGLSAEDIGYWMELDKLFVEEIAGLHKKYPSYDAKRLQECIKK